MTQSSSDARRKGNEEFKKAFGFPPASTFVEIRIRHVEEAKRLYTEASKLASGVGDSAQWLLAKRSLGIASLKLASFEDYQNKKSRELVLYQFKEALRHLSEALHYGHTLPMDAIWLDDIASKIGQCCEMASSYILISDELNYGQRCSLLANLITQPETQTLAVALIQYMITDEILKAAIIADEAQEWQRSFSLCGESERSMIECSTALGKVSVQYRLYPELTVKYNDLMHTRWSYLARSESAKLRAVADGLKDKLLFENEDLDIELAWICIDQYRAAMIAASRTYEGAVSLENEAIAASHLAQLLDKVLKSYREARALYMHTLRLADAITHQSGAVFFHCEWYQTAKRGIEEDNARNEAFDAAEVAKQREPVMQKLKPALDAIDAAVASYSGRDYSAYAVLVHIHSKHPPKSKQIFDPTKLDRNKSEDVSEAVKKAVTYYHPDRSWNKLVGVEWLILCEEITKTLNNCYARYK